MKFPVNAIIKKTRTTKDAGSVVDQSNEYQLVIYKAAPPLLT
jgi:hypothetical protein